MNVVEFAKTIGVARATVYRAITGDGHVSPKTREFILNKAKELDLRPSRSAQALRTGRTYMVELWIPNLDAPFSGFILAKLQMSLNAKGFELIVRRLDYEEEIPRYSHRNAHWPIEGVLAVDPSDSAITFLRESMGPAMPIVNIGGAYLSSTDLVGIDDYWGAAEATRHLIKQAGCRKITYVTTEVDIQFGYARGRGVMDTARDTGVEVELVLLKKPTAAQGWRAMYEFVEAHGHPDGLFCVNDSVAIGAQSALIQHGVKIPDDTAMVGCDGLDFTEFLPIPLTTIQAPLSKMCDKASVFLLNRIEENSLPTQEVMFRPSLLVRESSKRS